MNNFTTDVRPDTFQIREFQSFVGADTRVCPYEKRRNCRGEPEFALIWTYLKGINVRPG